MWSKCSVIFRVRCSGFRSIFYEATLHSTLQIQTEIVVSTNILRIGFARKVWMWTKCNFHTQTLGPDLKSHHHHRHRHHYQMIMTTSNLKTVCLPKYIVITVLSSILKEIKSIVSKNLRKTIIWQRCRMQVYISPGTKDVYINKNQSKRSTNRNILSDSITELISYTSRHCVCVLLFLGGGSSSSSRYDRF